MPRRRELILATLQSSPGIVNAFGLGVVNRTQPGTPSFAQQNPEEDPSRDLETILETALVVTISIIALLKPIAQAVKQVGFP